jgi:hypothetical protein
MANLHKLTVQEAMNASGPGGVWTVNTAATINSNADTTGTTHTPVSGAGQLGLYSSVEIYFSFSNTNVGTADGVDITTIGNHLILPANVLTFITVPRGLGSTIYFNILSTTTTVGTCRIVEV